MTAEELLERYAAGQEDFTGMDLQNADLSDAELTYARLINANFNTHHLLLYASHHHRNVYLS
jgi:uncharacterized protein YjbI with pentapeptide repeats